MEDEDLLDNEGLYLPPGSAASVSLAADVPPGSAEDLFDSDFIQRLVKARESLTSARAAPQNDVGGLAALTTVGERSPRELRLGLSQALLAPRSQPGLAGTMGAINRVLLEQEQGKRAAEGERQRLLNSYAMEAAKQGAATGRTRMTAEAAMERARLQLGKPSSSVVMSETQGPMVVTYRPDGSSPTFRKATPQEVQASNMGTAAPSAEAPAGGAPAPGAVVTGADGAKYLDQWDGSRKKIEDPSPEFEAARAGKIKAAEMGADVDAKATAAWRDTVMQADRLDDAIGQAQKIIESGDVITGFGANQRLDLARMQALAGDKRAQQRVEATETFAVSAARQVGEIIKQFGAGTGLSDADRQFATRLAAGDITLDEATIKELLRMQRIINENVRNRPPPSVSQSNAPRRITFDPTTGAFK